MSWVNICNTFLVGGGSTALIGLNTALLTAKLKNGTSIFSETWTTNIVASPKAYLPFNLRGNLNFASNMYSYSEADSATVYGKAKDDAATWLDVYGNWKKLFVQSNIYVSSQEKANQQAVNRYTIGLRMPWWETWFGDSSPFISPYTMSNRNVRGIYAKAQTKYFKLSWVHGEMLRKTISDLAISDSVATNTGTYRQEAIAARLQLGPDEGFHLAFNAVRNRDIKSSQDIDAFSYAGTSNDTLYTVTPQDNLVLSFEAKMTVPEQRVVLGFEAAGSMYNRNTLPGAMTTEEIENYVDEEMPINLDSFRSLFTLNKNMEPILPGKANLAWQGYFRTYFYFFWENLFSISYSEIGSAFRSLSTNYQQNDTKNVSVSHQISYKHLFIANAGYTQTRDNLMKHRNQSNQYQSYHGQAMLRLPRLPYLRAAFFSNVGENSLQDSIPGIPFVPYLRNAQSASIGMGYTFENLPYVPTQVELGYRMGNEDNKLNSVSTYENHSNGMNFSLINRYKMIPLKTQFSFGSSSQELNNEPSIKLDTQNFNLLFQADYSVWQHKLKPYIQYRSVNLGGDQDSQAYHYYTLGFSAYPMKNMTVNSSLSLQSYQNKDQSERDHQSTTWRLTLGQRF